MVARLSSKTCSTEGCNRAANKNKRHCGKWRNEHEKKTNLVGWAFRKLKSNAKRRGHFFDLSLAQFALFCFETDILLGRGRSAISLHVDKIKDELGYTAGNLQKLPNRDNVKKENERRRKRKIYDYELAHRKKIGAISCDAEAAISEFRFVDDTRYPDTVTDELPAPF